MAFSLTTINMSSFHNVNLTPTFSEAKLLETVILLFPDPWQSQPIKPLKIISMFRDGQFSIVNFKINKLLKDQGTSSCGRKRTNFSSHKSNVCVCFGYYLWNISVCL